MRFAGYLLIVIALALHHPARGQELDAPRDTVYAMSPVLVTATKAAPRISPVTLSNLDRSDILASYTTQDIPVLLSDLPSITTYSENGSGMGYTYINLRGFDQRRLSVMINGVPQNDPEDHNVYWIDFPDLLANTQDIQVQRGAGSAFYGPPAIGGSVNIIANPFRPQPYVEAETMVGFQEFGGDGATRLTTRKQALTVNSGWIDRSLMVYGRVGRIRTDGYRHDGWVDLSSFFIGALRADETMTTRVHLFGGPIADGLAYVGLPKSYNTDRTLRRLNYSYWEYDSTGSAVGFAVPQKRTAIENFSQPHLELIHDWKLSDRVTFHATAFMVRGDGFFDYDGDWIPYTPGAVDWFRRNVGYDSTFGVSEFPEFLIRGAVENRQWGLLPRVTYEHGSGTLTAGVEARIHRSRHYGEIRFTSQLPYAGYDPTQKIYDYNGQRDIVSLFLHEVYRLRPDLSLTADLQVVHNRYGIRNEKFLGNAFDVRYLFVNPRVGINVNLTDRLHAYGFVGHTTREPRMRNLYAASDAYFGATPSFEAQTLLGGGVRYDYSKPLARPERLLNVEAGAGWNDRGLSLSANLFWMEFSDELVKSGKVDIFGQPVTSNAARTRHIGVELEGRVRLLAELTLAGNAAFSRNRHVTYEESTPSGLVRYDGNRIAGFPDLLGNLRLTWDDGVTSASVAVKHVGAFRTDNTDDPLRTNDAYTTVNATLLRSVPVPGAGSLRLRAEVRNLFDALYTTGGEGEAFFPAAERNYMFGVTFTL